MEELKIINSMRSKIHIDTFKNVEYFFNMLYNIELPLNVRLIPVNICCVDGDIYIHWKKLNIKLVFHRCGMYISKNRYIEYEYNKINLNNIKECINILSNLMTDK